MIDSYILSSFTIMSLRKRVLVALLYCVLAVVGLLGALCLYIAVLWAGLLSVLVAFPGHTRPSVRN